MPVSGAFQLADLRLGPHPGHRWFSRKECLSYEIWHLAARQASPAAGFPLGLDIAPILGRRPKTQLEFPSIGSERKTYFPHRRGFFDPGVCSRSGWAVSS